MMSTRDWLVAAGEFLVILAGCAALWGVAWGLAAVLL
jgi:hypothetical protein